MKTRNKIVIGIIVVAILILVSFIGYSFLVKDNDKSKTTETIVDPALYQACDEDSCIYLLGTIHVGDERIVGLTDKIWDAYNKSDAIAFELDITIVPTDSAEDLIYLPEGDDLANYLTEEQFDKLQDFFNKRFITMDVVRTFNLAGVTALLEELAYLEQNLLSDNGVDMQLLNKAHSDNKEIIELESYEFQANLLYNFKDEYYLEQIDAYLDDYSVAKRSAQLLYDSYLTGNVWLIKQLMGSTESTDELENEYNQKMLTERNLNMAEQAEIYLKENKSVMIAVGDAHVIGDKGLVELLTERGYEVSLVK